VSPLFRRPPSPDAGEDEQTVIDGTPFVDEHTPVDPPQCPECKAIANLDDFDERSLASFPAKVCSRAADGHWYVCVNYSPTHIKIVNYVRRR